MWKIPLFKPDYSAKERNALLKVFDEGWLAMGKYTSRFEGEFSKYLGGNVESAAVSSCTAALHIALMAANVGKGDEVLIPALTFVADLNVVMMVGAKPVTVDVASLTDWNMSFDDFFRKITPKTKAAIVVHFAGYPFDPRITELCQKKKIILIEDCAHAIGASIGGKMCGTLGDMAAFSFYANKNLAVGEGGMFVSPVTGFAGKARLLRSHGMTALSLERNLGKLISYDVRTPGLNYRISEINSAIGLEQLKKLDKGIQKRKKLVDKYIFFLSRHRSSAALTIPFVQYPENVQPAFHIFPALLPENIERKEFMEHLQSAGIQSSIHYPAFRHFSGYKKQIKDKTPLADAISSRAVTLPLYPGMSHQDVEYICKSIAAFFNK
ncbi:MAG: DegT/DnrJ/EryC1/StrS family aminotransferase [Spirochaetia bacterium]|nr:DegT/DnrJ/EryC1/StrS family aminotransferase [Spirochaetia bacterium]